MGCINVCLSCDDNYSKYAGVVVASILDKDKNKKPIPANIFCEEL